MHEGRRTRILLVARHPVGGILTFFRYIYGQQIFNEYDFTVVVPGKELQEPLAKLFAHGDFVFIACDSSMDMIKKTWRYIRENDVGLVNSHGFSAGLLMVPVTKLNNVPHIVTTHDIFQERHFAGFQGKLKKLALSVMFRFMDAIHTVGREATDNLREYFPNLRDDRIHCIPNGIDTDEFYSANYGIDDDKYGQNHPFLIGFFGRFMSQKGFGDLVDAVDIILRRKLSDRKLMVQTYGWSGFIREEYQHIEERGLKEYFHSMPHTENMPKALREVDLVVMPSLWEACPLLAMEALVAGVPIVGTNCIGLNEVLSGSPATMVSPKDPESLATAIANEMNNDRQAEFIEYSAVAKDRFSLDHTSLKVKELYEKLAKRNEQQGTASSEY